MKNNALSGAPQANNVLYDVTPDGTTTDEIVETLGDPRAVREGQVEKRSVSQNQQQLYAHVRPTGRPATGSATPFPEEAPFGSMWPDIIIIWSGAVCLSGNRPGNDPDRPDNAETGFRCPQTVRKHPLHARIACSAGAGGKAFCFGDFAQKCPLSIFLRR